jgi:hypothetical protein
MKIRRLASGTDAVFILALAFVLAACQYPAGKGITINIPAGGASSGDIDKIINEAITQGSGNDGSAPDKPLDLIINGLEFEDIPGMVNLFSALRKYYVNLTFGPGSGTAFKDISLQDTQGKSRILSITLHGEVIEIGPNAFNGWTGLTTVKLPCVTNIGRAAFYNCIGLKTINFPAANFIGDSAFRNCAGLEIISLPVANFIGDSAFRNCTSLEMVSLPMAIFVGDSAFYGCTNLERVEFPTVQSLGCQVFSNTGKKTIDLVFTLYPPEFVDASGTRITTGINLFGSSSGKQVTVNAPAYFFDKYEVWGKKNGTDTEKTAFWGDGITVMFSNHLY